MTLEELQDFPGSELILTGIADLKRGRQSIEAILVLIAAPNLSRMQLPLPPLPKLRRFPEHELYERLESESPRSAHARYNALLRRVVSFEHALEAHRGRMARKREKNP